MSRFVFLLFGAQVLAGPPLDLHQEEGERGTSSRPRITQDDLVYGANADPDPRASEMATLLSNAPARSLPNRNGKVLFRFAKGERVRVLRESKDQRWWAVESLTRSRRAWVPKAAVKTAPDFKLRPQSGMSPKN